MPRVGSRQAIHNKLICSQRLLCSVGKMTTFPLRRRSGFQTSIYFSNSVRRMLSVVQSFTWLVRQILLLSVGKACHKQHRPRLTSDDFEYLHYSQHKHNESKTANRRSLSHKASCQTYTVRLRYLNTLSIGSLLEQPVVLPMQGNRQY